MIRENKGRFIVSCIVILLPILFGLFMWEQLPDMMHTHWGASGTADRISGKLFTVFGIPAILLAFHVLCFLLSTLDKRQKEQNPKSYRFIFYLIPVLSLWVNGIIYSAALGKEMNVLLAMPLLFGGLFMIIGNYMPKVTQNRTLGIKLSWTLRNEENWNKTHRFAGKVWFIGGLLLLFAAFLPVEVMFGVCIGVIALLVLFPVGYSYQIYLRHKKEGIQYEKLPMNKAEQTATNVVKVVVPLILVAVAVLMFTGSLDADCGDTSLTIQATFSADSEIAYTEIDTVDYRKNLDVGMRTYGFASAKFLLGNFRNDEFGSYTLYAYTKAKEHLVLTSGEKVLVIGFDDAGKTQALYDELLEKLAK